MSKVSGTFNPRQGILVEIGIAAPDSFAVQGAPRPIPKIVKVKALLDTGASRTSIKAKIAEELNMRPAGQGRTYSTHGEKATNWYDGDVVLYFDDPPSESHLTPEIQLNELHPSASVDALLGRDVLCQCDFKMTKDHGFVLSL